MSDSEKAYLLPNGSNVSTFRMDGVLPSLPLPDLEDTLSRYIESVKPFVTEQELANTRKLTVEFKNGVGKQLQSILKEKAAKSKNWVEAWWEEYAYHRVRVPLLPFCSMDGMFPVDALEWASNDQEDQIRNGAMYVYFTLDFWQQTRSGRIKPSTSADRKTTFSMSQFRRMFNTVRVPGEERDQLACYFKTNTEGNCPSHIVIFCRGKMFRVETLDAKGELLTPPELATIFRRILKQCENHADDKVAVLTCDERTQWSKNRQILTNISANNANALSTIESAVLHLVLDDVSPNNDSEVSNANLFGARGERWADKSLLSVVYANGRIGGISEHSAYDGIASITMMHYCLLAVNSRKGGWQGRIDVRDELVNFEEIKFDLNSSLKSEIRRVTAESLKSSENVVMTRNRFNDFGKTEMQKCNLHPDAFVQMAVQLTYARMHRRLAPCYETATTRGFYNGRTETVRACTQQCLDWVAAMTDSKASEIDKQNLLQKAVDRHNKLMAESRDGQGCDRHLFGLYCTALEEGLPIPDIFNDPAYTKSGGGGNFVLSTSLTGYTACGGGVAPMVQDGYGVFYCIQPKWMTFTVSTYKNSDETDAEKFFTTLGESLREVRDLMLNAKPLSKL